MVGKSLILLAKKNQNTVNFRFKKDLNLQIHLHKAFFSDNQFLDSYHKSFLNQTTLDLRKEKWIFLNREFTVLRFCLHFQKLANNHARWIINLVRFLSLQSL